MQKVKTYTIIISENGYQIAGAKQINDQKEEQSMKLTLEEAQKRMAENNGNLNLRGTAITALPESLTVGGEIIHITSRNLNE